VLQLHAGVRGAPQLHGSGMTSSSGKVDISTMCEDNSERHSCNCGTYMRHYTPGSRPPCVHNSARMRLQQQQI
jgi:hypothetical protein